MKKGYLTFFIVLILMFTANYIYSGFFLSNTTTLSKESMNIGENYYLGYGLHWRGLLKPVLVDVRLRNKDGSIIAQNHDKVEATPFIDVLQRTGASDEADFIEDSAKGLIEYVSVKEATIKDANTLVLRINLKDEDYENTVEGMVLNYRIFGIPKRQVVEYNGFLN